MSQGGVVDEVQREVNHCQEEVGKSEGWRQYVSSLSIMCIAVFIGLPLWWKTTEVYRCPLPYADIQALTRQQVPPLLVFTVSVTMLDNESDVSTLVARLHEKLNSQRVSVSSMETTIAYNVQPLALAETRRREIAEAVFSQDYTSLSPLIPHSPLGHYSILVVPGDTKSRVILSSERWALIHAGIDMVPVTERVVRQMVSGGQLLSRVLEVVAERRRERDSVNAESMRQIRAALGYQVSVTLLVPDPSQVTVDWNIEEATQEILVPFLSHPGIASLGNFTTSSQVFYYTDVKFKPRSSRSGGYFIPSNSLPPMISSVESKLGSLVSQQPSINFLVYVTRHTHSPLYIQDPQGHLTNNFLVPQWGGVVFYNPPEWTNGSDVRGREGKKKGGEAAGVQVRMREVMAVFVKQLQMLLGLPSEAAMADRLILESESLGITDWQVDQLLVARMLESVSMATTALISLVQLLDKVKNMVISDIIQQEVISSLNSVQECHRLAELGDLNSAYTHARMAMFSAETAFFDPSILELLYFPDDQKFAIYIPLFLPISVPIMMSSVAAVRWLTQLRNKANKEKTD